MTSIKFDRSFSIGTIITLLGLIVSVAVTFALTQADVDLLGKRMDAVEGMTALIPAQVQTSASLEAMAKDNAARIRAVETYNAGQGARFDALSKMMDEMRAEVRQTNDLLRRYLARDGGER